MGHRANLFQKIYALRREKRSYSEIAKTLGISESTVSYWIANDPLSQKVRIELAKRARKENGRKLGLFSKERWQKYREKAVQEATGQFPAYSNDPLFVAGIMLYWGEGDSNPRNALKLSNTAPGMIRLYVKFLLEVMNIPAEKIKIELILYPDLSDKRCKGFWSRTAGLPTNSFFKTQYIRGRHPTRRLSNGICMIIVNDRYVKIKMLSWIDIFQEQYTING